MSKTVSSIVILIGMTLGSTVESKTIKNLVDEEYFSNRQEMRNETIRKRINQVKIIKELDKETEEAIEFALDNRNEFKINETPNTVRKSKFYNPPPLEEGFNIATIFKQLKIE